MKKTFFSSVFFLLLSTTIFSQHYNPYISLEQNYMMLNPAFTGHYKYMLANMTYNRGESIYNDWMPNANFINFNIQGRDPKNDKIGIGGSLQYYDFYQKKFKTEVDLSYRFDFNDGKDRLSIGATASLMYYDYSFDNWYPNWGIGLFYNKNINDHSLYLGCSALDLRNTRLLHQQTIQPKNFHFYIGGDFQLAYMWKLKTSILYRDAYSLNDFSLNPFLNSIDRIINLDVGFLYAETMELGIMINYGTRLDKVPNYFESINIHSMYCFRNGWRIGLNINLPIQSQEIQFLGVQTILAYRLNLKSTDILSARYL